MRYAMIFAAVAVLAAVSSAQTTLQTAAELEAERSRSRAGEGDLNQRMDDMRRLDSRLRSLSRNGTTIETPQLTKEQRERVLTMRRVDPASVDSYIAFIKSPNSGVFKIFPDLECVTPKVVKLDGDCRGFVPESSHFSFRQRGYGPALYHDLGYGEGIFRSRGLLTQGVFADLGDIPIESLTKASPELAPLAAIVPAANFSEARSAAASYSQGVTAGDLKLADTVEPKEGKTYGFRIIAYRIANAFPPPTEATGIDELQLMSLEYDKRADLLVVFRVVKQEANGGIVVVWRELDRREAPKIKFGKGETPADIRPAEPKTR